MKDFAPYPESMELKELGFDEPCITSYNKSEKLFKVWEDEQVIGITKCSAPTYSQAFRWFREKYKLQHLIWSGKITKVFYGYDILHIDKQKYIINNSENGGGDCNCKTYEEAELACLRKLIEIVKLK